MESTERNCGTQAKRIRGDPTNAGAGGAQRQVKGGGITYFFAVAGTRNFLPGFPQEHASVQKILSVFFPAEVHIPVI